MPQTNGPGTDNFISIPAKYTPSNLAGKWETPIPHRGRFAGADQWSRCHRIPKTEIPQTHGISHQASKWSPQPNLMDHQVQRKENHHPLNTALVWPLHGYENVRWSPRYKKKSKWYWKSPTQNHKDSEKCQPFGVPRQAMAPQITLRLYDTDDKVTWYRHLR